MKTYGDLLTLCGRVVANVFSWHLSRQEQHELWQLKTTTYSYMLEVKIFTRVPRISVFETYIRRQAAKQKHEISI